jgi:4-amino-4-deoxy-L-arabinose transferase-like glycosyltransferase
MNTRLYSARILLAFALVALVICSIPVFGTRFLNDMDFYSLFADKLLSGRLLYRDAMDTKPPLVYFHYALVFKLFGSNNVVAVKIVTIASLGLSALVLVDLRKALSPSAAAPALVALIFILASFSGWGEDFLSSNTEILANLFILVGVWLLALHAFAYRPFCLFIGGCSIGMACLYRYQSGAALLAYAGTMVLRPKQFDHKILRSLLVLSGAALPGLLFVAAYVRIGALVDLKLLLAYQAHYACDADPISVTVVLGRLASTLSGLWPIMLLAIGQTVAILKMSTPASQSEIFQLLFAGCSAATFCIGGRFFPHYFVQAIPPLVLLAAERLGSDRPRSWFEVHAMAILITSAAVFTTINGIAYWTRDPPPSHPNLVTFVQANSSPTDEVLLWVWQPQLLFETKRAFATRLLVNEVLIGRGDPAQPDRRRAGLAELWPIYLRDFTAAPPRLIFDAPLGQSEWPFHRFPQLAELLSRYYQPCQILDGVCVYLRRD